MEQEIFGPILPIFEYDKFDEVDDIIDKYKNPLALYIFTKNRSFGEKFLRKHSSVVGLKSNFTILDIEDQKKLVKQVISFLKLDNDLSENIILSEIQNLKDEILTAYPETESLYNSISKKFKINKNSLVLTPGSDAAIIRIHNKDKAIAVSVDSSANYCKSYPLAGGKQIVCENWRNLISVGAKPLAITNCLNFGNPENQEIMDF